MSTQKDNLAKFDRQDRESEMLCPFCGDSEFDRIGLKYHLENSCEEYEETKTIKLFWLRKE